MNIQTVKEKALPVAMLGGVLVVGYLTFPIFKTLFSIGKKASDAVSGVGAVVGDVIDRGNYALKGLHSLDGDTPAILKAAYLRFGEAPLKHWKFIFETPFTLVGWYSVHGTFENSNW